MTHVVAAPVRGVTVAEVLGASTLAGARVLAGRGGLGRVIERLNVMEVPDILPWVKPREFLLTTAYPLRHDPDSLPALLSGLDERGLAGLGIKLGRYIDDVPAALLDRAEALGFPVVQLPDEVGFDDILNEVLTEILNRQAAALARSERTHRALVQVVLTGGGLDELVGEVSALLGCPTFVAAPDGRVLATSGAGQRAEGGTLGAVPAEWVRREHERGGQVLSVAISAGSRDHGRIVAIARERPLEEADRIALENAATVAALAITKAQAVQAAESKFGADLLHDLLRERISNANEAAARAAALGWDLERRLSVLVLEPAGHRLHVSARTERLVADTARELDPGAAVVVLTDEIVVVTGAGAAAEPATRRSAEEVHRAAGADGMVVTAGMSRVVDGPLGLADAYGQATAALRIGREMAGPGVLTRFDDLGALRLLALVPDARELDRFACEVLGPFAGDDAEARDHRTTLGVLLDTNLNLAETARRLHFHYNTVRYRVAKLEAALGPFTTDSRVRLELHLALQIVRLRTARAVGGDQPAR